MRDDVIVIHCHNLIVCWDKVGNKIILIKQVFIKWIYFFK